MRLVWKSLDKMRCLRKRSTIPFLGFLITFLLFLNLYIEDGYVLVCTFSLLPASPGFLRYQDDTCPRMSWEELLRLPAVFSADASHKCEMQPGRADVFVFPCSSHVGTFETACF